MQLLSKMKFMKGNWDLKSPKECEQKIARKAK